MYLNNEFKLVKRDKWIILIIVGTFFVLSIISLIVTSWYEYDEAIAKEFAKAITNSFVRGWTGYWIMDAYILIISFAIPIGFVLLESLYKWISIKKPNSSFAKHKKSILIFYVILAIVYPLVAIYYLGSMSFADYGFGIGFIHWFMIGLSYIIPIFVVSIVVNVSIYWSLLYYVHNNLAKREDFLTNSYWKKSIILFVTLIISYIVVLVVKDGVGRPYWFNIDWKNWSNEIDKLYPQRYEHYISQTNNIINYGWTTNPAKASVDSFPTDSQWPWWKIAKGTFDTSTSYYNNLPISDAFPSGHMVATSTIALSLWVLFGQPNSKKMYIWKWISITAIVVYLLNMIFSLEMSAGHWWSDMAFSLVMFWIVFAICNLVTIYSQKIFINKTNSQTKLMTSNQ